MCVLTLGVYLFIFSIKKMQVGNSLVVVQWLGLCASTVGGIGLIPGKATNIPPGSMAKKKEKKEDASRLMK